MVRSQPRTRIRGGISRSRGTAAVELAFLLPFICLTGLGIVDCARVFNSMTTITNCARNGAIWAASQANNPSGSPSVSPFTSVQAAAQADANGLSITATRVPTSGTLTDANGNSYVGVTVSYTFTTTIIYPSIPGYPFIPSSTTLSKTVYMPVYP